MNWPTRPFNEKKRAVLVRGYTNTKLIPGDASEFLAIIVMNSIPTGN
ncbi:hypothetical protein [Sphaerochaeta halotolerans]|nr:hypothetical protein [Sphaerochaeta halotolerans]MXI85239.1 hypothetical protein [Sphaerochaeta halotolerans]